MKGTRDIVSSNIVEGKRKRVMSTEAVKSLVTQEITDNLLRQHRHNIIQEKKTIPRNQESEKNKKTGIKNKKFEQKLELTTSKVQQERTSQGSKILKVPITKKSLEKLIDQYFYIVTSSESESDGSSVESEQGKKNKMALKKQLSPLMKKNSKEKIHPQNDTQIRTKQENLVKPLSKQVENPKLKQVIQIKQNEKSPQQKNIKIPHKHIKHYEEDCIPSVQNLISQIESTE